MSKGSIRFDNGANIEVEVDKAAESGAKLLSAINLVDGQELGIGGSSDGGYDLLIEYDYLTANYSILSGNILDCEDKLDNDDIVKATIILKGAWSYIPSSANLSKTAIYMPLSYFDAPYTCLRFGAVYHEGTQIYARCVDVSYDSDTGDIIDISFAQKAIS